MIPLPITPEEYAKHFPPAPDYLLVQRIPVPESIGRIKKPDSILEASRRFVGIGKILAVSDLPSDDSFVEQMKEVYRQTKYVGFSYHVPADVVLLDQFILPRDVSLILIHVKDGAQIPFELDQLLEKQKVFEAEQLKRELVA